MLQFSVAAALPAASCVSESRVLAVVYTRSMCGCTSPFTHIAAPASAQLHALQSSSSVVYNTVVQFLQIIRESSSFYSFFGVVVVGVILL